jgi:hypothetical protein
MSTPSKILSGSMLREQLSKIIPEVKSLIVISAFITKPAIDWLAHYVSQSCSVVLIGRLLPNDFIVGSSDIEALRASLLNDWNVKCLTGLHAKIYLCDRSKIFIGSANLTTNGLKIYGSGNLEGCVEIPAVKDNIEFVEKINREAQIVNLTVLEKMESFINTKSKNASGMASSTLWPEDILPREHSIWVYDFPWVTLDASTNPIEQDLQHDAEILSVNDLSNKANVAVAFKNAKVFCWLLKKLKRSESNELYYGKLTVMIHDELRDDPAPYRRDVKVLLSNLLTYCQKYAPELIKIDRPNHSQRVTLIQTG